MTIVKRRLRETREEPPIRSGDSLTRRSGLCQCIGGAGGPILDLGPTRCRGKVPRARQGTANPAGPHFTPHEFIYGPSALPPPLGALLLQRKLHRSNRLQQASRDGHHGTVRARCEEWMIVVSPSALQVIRVQDDGQRPRFPILATVFCGGIRRNISGVSAEGKASKLQCQQRFAAASTK